MSIASIWLSAVLAVIIVSTGASCTGIVPAASTDVRSPAPATATTLKLPPPRHSSNISVEESLLRRRSVREYSEEALTLAEVSQLVWAAQGVTHPSGLRTAPSAGALYPLEVYVIAGRVTGLVPGVYKYRPGQHELLPVSDGDIRRQLAEAALGQDCVAQAAVNIVLSTVYQRTTSKYGERGVRYAHIEAGHAAQNICLQATALGLGAVTVGAFHDDRVKNLLRMPVPEEPLYIIPAGRKRPG